jgi:uncharacterized repeat protein (TIGR02543 family)
MKKFIVKPQLLLLVLLLLAISTIPFGLFTVSAADGGENTDFNLFEIIGEIPQDFIDETTEMIESNWDENYFSSITIKLGETEMYVDGSVEMISIPAIMEDGEILLPIIDIANAVGAEVDIDEEAGSITIFNDGEIALELPLEDEPSVFAAQPENTAVADRSAAPVLVKDGQLMMTSPLVSAAEVEEALALDIHCDGDWITIAKPYQLKQLVLYVKDGQGLDDSYGAEQFTTDEQGLYFLQYPSEKLAQEAYWAFQSAADIAYISVNQVVKTAALSDRWGSERIGADRYKTYLINNNKAANPLTVAVLDTGLDANHPHLQGRSVAGYNFASNSSNTYDGNNHGTHVAGTIVDCTTANVKIMPVKVLDDSGGGTDLSISLGIKYAADNGAKVINLSLGGTCTDSNCILKQAIDYAMAKGAATVAAAGNDGGNTTYVCPAKLANVITVSAFDIRDMPASFTNYGAAVDVAAPGVDILSSVPGGGYDYYSGTSMAAPHVTAAVAMLKLDNMNATPAQLKTAVRNAAAPVTGISSSYYGAGLLNLNKVFGAIPAEPPGIKLSRHAIDVKTVNAKYRTYQMIARVTPLTTANKSVNYSSSNPQVAVCGNDGLVQIKRSGTAIITAKAVSGGYTDTCAVTVNVDDSKFWIGSAADSFAGGAGTKANPYKIANPEQLALLSRNSRLLLPGGGTEQDEYFELTADIDLSGKEWVTIGWYESLSEDMGWMRPFSGYFNGNGYVVKNMSQGNSYSGLGAAEAGLFYFIGGEIKNLGIVDANQKGANSREYPWWSGVLATYAGGCVIDNCYTTGKTLGYGFVLEINGYRGIDILTGKYTPPIVKNCYSTAETSSGRGFASSALGATISNCYFYGTGNLINQTYAVSQTYKTNIANSFMLEKGSSPACLVNTKADTVISRSYCAGSSYRGVMSDDNPSTTDISQKPLDFFKDSKSYTSSANWNSQYPWDFENTWAIDPNINNGLPYLKIFKINAVGGGATNWELVLGAANSKSGVITEVKQIDKYRFTAPISGTYTFFSSNKALSLTYLDAYLYNSAGALLTSQLDYGIGFNLSYNLTAGQTYALDLLGFWGTGAYTVNIAAPSSTQNNTVTYNYSENGGTSASKTSSTVNPGAPIDLTPTAIKGNWKFVGWNTNKDATAGLSALTMGPASVTLYAIYSKTLNADFIDYSGTSQQIRNVQATIYNKATSGNILMPAQNTYSGWTPRGWGIATAPGAPAVAGSSVNYPISVDTVFFGLYNRTLTLSYNANGGSTAPPSQSGTQFVSSYSITTYANPTLVLANPITRPVYAFAGWALGSPSGQQYPAGGSVAIAADTTMYAVWGGGTNYTVTYNYSENGGASASKTRDTLNQGAAIDLTPKAAKADWTFVGWNTNKDATSGLSSLTMGAADVTLYAIYSRVLSALFIDYNVISQYARIAHVTIYNKASGGSVLVPPQNNYAGWTARGWSTLTTADTAVMCKADDYHIITQATIFYGLYSRTLNLHYNANGGSSTPNSQSGLQYANSCSITTYANPSFTLASPITRPDHAFDGWAMGSPGGPKYSSGGSITIAADTTMYASWGGGTILWSFASEKGLLNSKSGFINSEKQIDRYQFTAPVSGSYVFLTTNKAPSLIYLHGYLYNSAGSLLASNEDTGSGLYFGYDLIAGQTYYLDLQGHTGTGAYTVNAVIL